MINVAVVGAKGFAGEELIKILLKHKGVKITSLSDKMEGKNCKISDIYPYMEMDILCEDVDIKKISSVSDVIFTALPHKVSMEFVEGFIKAGKKVIDLSADYRLKDPAVYEKWYGVKHINQEMLSNAIYGLPEIYRGKIKKAKLIANPGCYPTSVILACFPLIKEKLISKKSIIIDAKSGYSGGGREFVKKYKEPNTYAYQVGNIHRHIPEIEQELSSFFPVYSPIKVTFTPHIIPQERGMLSTVYLELKKNIFHNEVVQIYKQYYESEPFVRVVESAQTKNVVNTNYCDIAVDKDKHTKGLVITSAIDNLVKGASGQAVQNMNILSGLDEKEGLI
ncbi:MAG: N-acetyl-gamma-glutamyl-phosphate reductase [Elusimicrobia bacterium]|nr:N-acetyl-gamma-glutamyl-phosphate reductase [Elusimicrobiota bacterium]